jgi:hypothetical protein
MKDCSCSGNGQVLKIEYGTTVMANLKRKIAKMSQRTGSSRSQYGHFSSIISPEKTCYCGSQLKFQDCHMRGLVLPSGAENGMDFQWIGGVRIYRPGTEAEKAVRLLAEPALRKRFTPGVYTALSETQEILHERADVFGTRFDQLIGPLASRSFLDFVFWQYNQCGIVEGRRKRGELSGEALTRWIEVNHKYPRALKYIAERITMLSPDELADERMPSIQEIGEAVICAEELVSYCITSDLTCLFPNKTEITIHPKGREHYINHILTTQEPANFQARIYADTPIRHSFFETKSYEFDHEAHAVHLDKPLFDSIGVTYTEALRILASLKDGCTSIPGDPFNSKFVLVSGVVDRLSALFKKPNAVVEKLLSGFWLTKEMLESRALPNHDYWKPSNHYRAYRRGLFILPHSLDRHMAFSDQMFTEAFTILKSDVSFGAFPKEWRTTEVTEALGKIAAIQGHWFERQVQINLQKIGIAGLTGKRTLGTGRSVIKLPGEFDFIGVSKKDNALVLIEAKMTQPGSEPGLWKNQCENFTQIKAGKENFVQKLTRKSEWLSKNSEAVAAALKAENILVDIIPDKVLAGFITYAPLAASYLVPKFPCVSLSEFVNDYEKCMGWPYETGIHSINS